MKCIKIFLFNSHHKKKVIVALVQHLGDNVAAEPLDFFIRQSNPDSFIIRIIDVKFQEVIKYSPHHDRILTVSCLSEWIYIKHFLHFFYKIFDLHVHKSFCKTYRLAVYNPGKTGINVSNYYKYGNLLHIFCLNAGLQVINTKPVFWLSPKISLPKLPLKYVVIHVSSNSVEREWVNHKWIELIEFITNKYSLSVIEVGITSSLKYKADQYFNYCGKFSFSEIALLISKATIFIGIDSAFAHFANSFELKKLVLLGHFNLFESYLPYSGLTKQEELQSIVHYEGPLSQLEVGIVIDKLKGLLITEKRLE
jgi:heptosyltransferase-3